MFDLARASEDEVLKLWQGLGYYSRARNLLYTAKEVVEKQEGVFPNNYEGLLKLKGIGPYTAAAIASFAFNQKKVVIDGNVKRWVSRLCGIEYPIDKNATVLLIEEILDQMADNCDPALFNQAIMEFGALQCKPKAPLCENCILNSDCVAYSNGTVSLLPIKSKRIKKITRYFNYVLVLDKNHNCLIRKRPAGDIWQGLYEFPLFEGDDFSITVPAFLQDIGHNIEESLVSKSYKHILTHRIILARFYKVTVSTDLKGLKQSAYTIVPFSSLSDFAVPRLIDLYLNDLSITLF